MMKEMRMKKFALRGMIVLAVLIALCLLFSGTIRTLTTPKVRYAPARTGKFEAVTKLKGKVVFPEEEKLTLNIPEGASLNVLSVSVVPGQKVKKGDRLVTAVVPDADKTLASLEQEYETARTTLTNWERKNGGMRLNRNETVWMDAWDASLKADSNEQLARMNLLAQMNETDPSALPEALPEDADAAVTEAFTAWQEALSQQADAQRRLRDLDRFAVSEETWTLLQQKKDAETKMKDAADKIMTQRLLMKEADSIIAPHDAYIASVTAEKGGVIGPEDVVLTLTPEDRGPVIRADVSDIKQTIARGTKVSVDSDSWGWTETKVIAVGLSDSGHPYVDAEISEDVIWALGKVQDMMKKEEISLSMTTRAQDASCLLPASAVRGSGEARYVFTGEQESSAFAGNRIVVRKTPVTVLAESAETVSVMEDLNYTKVLYMEDRPIDEGAAVMLYEE